MKLFWTFLALLGLVVTAMTQPTGSTSIWSQLRKNVSERSREKDIKLTSDNLRSSMWST